MVLRREGDHWVEDWVCQILLVVGKDKDGDITESGVLWWGAARRRHVPGKDEWVHKPTTLWKGRLEGKQIRPEIQLVLRGTLSIKDVITQYICYGCGAPLLAISDCAACGAKNHIKENDPKFYNDQLELYKDWEAAGFPGEDELL